MTEEEKKSKIDWEKFGKNVYYKGLFVALKGLADDTENKIDDVLIKGLDAIDDKIIPPHEE